MSFYPCGKTEVTFRRPARAPRRHNANTAIVNQLAGGGARTPVVGRSSDTHAAEFVGVVFAVEDVPLFAAFEDFFFLRGDALADFGVGFLFVAERGGENLDDMLTDGVSIFNKFDVVAGHQHVGDLVGQADDFFAAESHFPWMPSNTYGKYGVQLTQDELAVAG